MASNVRGQEGAHEKSASVILITTEAANLGAGVGLEPTTFGL